MIAVVAATMTAVGGPVAAWAQQQLPGLVIQGASIEAQPATRGARPPSDSGVGAPAATVGSGPGTGDGPSDTVAGLRADKVGTAVSVITREELRQRQVRNGADALRSLPGVSVSRTGGPQNSTVVRLRGGESNHTLVLIDGQEINAGSEGVYFFENLAVEDIERIEVLRGPQSGLYGSGALAGAINIVTRSGKGPLTLQARAEAGSFDTREAALSLSGGTDRAHGILSLYGRRADGFDISAAGNEEDGFRLSNLSLAGGIKVLDNLKVDGTLRRSSLNGRRDGFATNGLYFTAVDDFSSFSSDVWLGRVSATLDTFADGRLVQRLWGGRTTTNVLDLDRGRFAADIVNGDPSKTDSRTTKYGYTGTARLDFPGASQVRHFVTGQIERQDESFQQPTNSSLDFQGKRERSTTGYVGELRGEYFDTLFLSGVVRRDQNDTFEDYDTWRVSGSLKVPATIFRLHASAGTGVKYPSFSELFGFFSSFRANPALTPEESIGWDAGVELRFLGGVAVLDVTYFKQNLKNEIDFGGKTDPLSGAFFFQPFNRDRESTREGIEVAARARLSSALTLGASYTYLKAREFDAATNRDVEEIRRAPHSGRVDANYSFAGGLGNLNLAVAYNGRMLDDAFPSDFSDAVRVSLKEYWLATAAASYKLTPTIEVFGRIENLFDQRYEEVFTYQTAGIAAYGGVRFTFEEPSTVAWAAYR